MDSVVFNYLNGIRTGALMNYLTVKGTGKGKVHPRTGHEGPDGEQMYSSTFPSTSALGWGGWSTPRPCRFTPGKTRYLLVLCRRLGGPACRSGRVRKISPPPGFDPRTVEPVANRFTVLSYPGPR
jgi:hypothetical protein